jgi:hypothetical protein
MMGPADDELIHRALDGALSPEEAERFRARVAADPAFGARAEGLTRLAAAVDELGGEEPPHGFTDRVMAEVASVSLPRPAWFRRLASWPAAIGRQLFPVWAHSSEQGSHSSEAFRRAGMAGGGVIVAKKVLWGVAGLAVVVILAVVYFNGRTVDQGAQGAIGAADRYRGAQPSGVNATPGNAQAFLQSDTFDKIIKNKEIRSLLGDPEACHLLTNDAVENALKDENVAALFKDAKLMASLGDPEVATALEAAEVQAFMADADVQLAMADDTVVAAFQTEAWEAALKNADTMRIFEDADVQATLKDQRKLAKLFADAEVAVKANKVKGDRAVKASEEAALGKAGVHAALNDKLFAAMMADPKVQEALSKGPMASLLTDDTFGAALNHGNEMANLLTDENFQVNMKAATKLFANIHFQEALKGSQVGAFDAFRPGGSPTSSVRPGGGAYVGSVLRLFANLQFRAAIGDPDFMAAIGNPDFEAALMNDAALKAKLREK